MRYGRVDKAFAMQLATYPPEQDGPVLMVNFMKYRAVADYAGDGSAGGAASAEPVSGREADDRYAPTAVLRDIGARVTFFGDVVADDGGPDPMWDRMGIVMYPTRRSFIEMQQRKDFQDKHVHKEAGMERTFNMTAVPVAAVAGDEPGRTVTFVAWPEGSTPPLPTEGALLHVEGTILGDGRRFSHLGVHFGDVDRSSLPDDALVARCTPAIDEMRTTIDSWASRL